MPNVALRFLKALRHTIFKFIVAIRSDSQDPFGSVDSKVQNTCTIFENIVKMAKEFVSRNDVFVVGISVNLGNNYQEQDFSWFYSDNPDQFRHNTLYYFTISFFFSYLNLSFSGFDRVRILSYAQLC